MQKRLPSPAMLKQLLPPPPLNLRKDTSLKVPFCHNEQGENKSSLVSVGEKKPHSFTRVSQLKVCECTLGVTLHNKTLQLPQEQNESHLVSVVQDNHVKQAQGGSFGHAHSPGQTPCLLFSAPLTLLFGSLPKIRPWLLASSRSDQRQPHSRPDTHACTQLLSFAH